MRKRQLVMADLMILVMLSLLFSTGMVTKMERKIIVYKSGTSVEQKARILDKQGAAKIDDLNLVNAQSAMVSAANVTALKNDPDVLLVEDDAVVTTVGTQGGTVKAQILPWGIDRIDAERCWVNTTGDPIKVAVIDTGIDTAHPDLKINIKGGVTFVKNTRNYTDDNGHGTHVAGIIGALNNTIGVVGVGPNIDLYAVKVLNRSGSGYVSDIIKGLEWCISNNIQVINMSLGTTAYSGTLEAAVQKVYAAGIVQVAAAGNDGGAVNYPAALDHVIAVGATDSSDQITSWSSRGPQVDLVAPGLGIYSTYKGSTYATLSGTSMATPHVTGAAALVIQVKGYYNKPNEVERQLEYNATDLGDSSFDSLYGNGLVNVYKAIQ